jgi:hypothetical protein
MDFTFEISSSAGLADQLGAQFSYMYTLGESCGWRYRLINPVTSSRRFVGQNPWKRILIEKANSNLRRLRIPCFAYRYDSSQIYDFLGLRKKQATESDYRYVVDAPLKQLLEGATSPQNINERVNRILTGKGIGDTETSQILLRLVKDNSYYLLMSSICEAIGLSDVQILEYAGEHFLRPHLNRETCGFLPKDGKNEELSLAHIRLGDSIYLPTEEGLIILNGSMAYLSFSDFYKEVRTTDTHRFPWCDPFLMSDRIEGELRARSFELSSLHLISDGFRSSHKALRTAARSGISGLTPSLVRAGHRKIVELERQFETAFKWIPEEKKVIGEGSRETIQSLDLIMRARLILCNSGGFSAYISQIYSAKERKTPFTWFGRDD